MPLITWGTGAASLADLSVVLRRDAEGVATLTWAYGNFIQTIIDFLIIAFSIFVMVKIVTASQKKFKEMESYVINQSKKEVKAERKMLKAKAKEENRSYKEVKAEYEAEKAKILEEKAQREAEEKARQDEEDKKNNPTQEELLKEIRDLLREQKNDKK